MVNILVMANKQNKRNNNQRRLTQQMAQLKKDTSNRAFIIRNLPVDPPAIMNSGDVWHDRTVTFYAVASTGTFPALGSADLTAGAMMSAMSANASNIPVSIVSIKCYGARGSASSAFPTQLQVDFNNEEFMQNYPSTSTPRDSIRDSGSLAHPPKVGLYVPASQRLVRADWSTSTSTVLAQAQVDGSATVRWIVNLRFKF